MGWLAHHLSTDADKTLWIDLEGARTLADAVLLTGCTIDATPPGHLPTVATKLASLPIEHLVWDARRTEIEVAEAANQMVTALTESVQCWAAAAMSTSTRDMVALNTGETRLPPPEVLPNDIDVLAWFSPSR